MTKPKPFSQPRSAMDAQARSKRKLKALSKRAFTSLHEIAGFWDEGQVSGDIDRLLDDLSAGIEAIESSMTEEIERMKED